MFLFWNYVAFVVYFLYHKSFDAQIWLVRSCWKNDGFALSKMGHSVLGAKDSGKPLRLRIKRVALEKKKRTDVDVGKEGVSSISTFSTQETVQFSDFSATICWSIFFPHKKRAGEETAVCRCYNVSDDMNQLVSRALSVTWNG